jgi:hypothetical protein
MQPDQRLSSICYIHRLGLSQHAVSGHTYTLMRARFQPELPQTDDRLMGKNL